MKTRTYAVAVASLVMCATGCAQNLICGRHSPILPRFGRPRSHWIAPCSLIATNAYPGVVFVSCGGWISGAKSQFWRQSAYLAERGFAAARPGADGGRPTTACSRQRAGRYWRAARLNAKPSGDQRMVCRDAVVEDGIGIARVWVAAWQAAYPGLMPAAYLAGLDVEAALPGIERDLRANPSVLVLELDGDILGFSRYGASRDPDAGPDTGEVMAVNLHPSWWRRGLGRGLLRETQRRLCGLGFSEATLWVLHGNASARQFYEALGWRLDGVEKHDDKLTGFALHEVRYRVALP